MVNNLAIEYIREKEGYLEIRMKLSKGTPSRSGKTLVVATTSGFVKADNSDISVSLNAIRKQL